MRLRKANMSDPKSGGGTCREPSDNVLTTPLIPSHRRRTVERLLATPSSPTLSKRDRDIIISDPPAEPPLNDPSAGKQNDASRPYI